MDYNYNPNSYMNPYPLTYQPYRGVTSSQVSGPQLDKVNGIDSARAFPMKPNSTIALFDANEDIMYIKSTDANNFATIRRFRFIEEPEVVPKNTEYVTIDEFNKFKEEILNGKQSIRSNKSGNGKSRANESSSASQKYDDTDSK